MTVLHLISGGDKGGAKTHVFTLLSALIKEVDINVICFMEGAFYQEIQEMPIPSMLIKQKYRNDLSIIPRLVKHIRSRRYHFIHTHGARANFIAVMLKPFIKIPIITTIHSDYRMDFTENLYKKLVFTKLNTIALRFLDYYVAVSNDFNKMLLERGFDSSTVYTVYNALDFDSCPSYVEKEVFLKRHDLKSSAENKTIVGIIGRFDVVKGHEIFIKSAAQVLKKRKDIIFLLAGEGPEEQNLRMLAKELGILEHIFFLGFVRDIFSFIHAIDINVCSSYSESFPYMLLEGAIMKKPTVSTAVGGIPDIILDGKTGYLVPSADINALAEKILALAENPEEADVLGQSLYNYAKENFSREKMCETHLEIYKSILQKEKEKGKQFDVMLSGYYGFRNSGDDAILKAIISSLRNEQKDISILVLSKDPKETASQFQVFSTNRSNIFKIINQMQRCRLFLNGGGSLIQDITSTQSLYYYTALMHFAKRYGLKVMLYANGIGPIIHKSNIPTARKALQICDAITLREASSFNELEKLCVENKNISLSSDPTLLINPTEESRLQEILKAEGISDEKRYFTVSFRAWKYNDPNFISKMTGVINQISQKYGLIPLFVPMQQPQDTIFSKEVITKLKTEAVLINGEYNVQELMGIIGKTEIVMAMRLHTLIYAVSMDIPVIGIVYDPKIQSFMKSIKQETYVDGSSIDTALLLKMTDNTIRNINDVKNEIRQASQKLKALCNNDAKIAVDLIRN